jgi:hypothetical protein
MKIVNGPSRNFMIRHNKSRLFVLKTLCGLRKATQLRFRWFFQSALQFVGFGRARRRCARQPRFLVEIQIPLFSPFGEQCGVSIHRL